MNAGRSLTCRRYFILDTFLAASRSFVRILAPPICYHYPFTTFVFMASSPNLQWTGIRPQVLVQEVGQVCSFALLEQGGGFAEG